MRDIFDEISEDLFDKTQSTEESSIEKLKSDLSSMIDRLDMKERKSEKEKMTSEVTALIKAEVAKIRPVQNIIERQIEQVIKHEQTIKHVQVPVNLPNPVIPPQKVREIIREVRIEAKDDGKEYAETKTVDELKKQIESLKKDLEDSKQRTAFALASRGGSGVIGIPAPEGNPEGYVLTVSGGKQKWKASSGGGLVAGTFSISNNTPNYTFDSTGSSIDVLYQVVATLIRKLQGEI